MRARLRTPSVESLCKETRPSSGPTGGQGIGCNEFARMIGADYPEVSRAATSGLITVIGTRENHNGRGAKVLDREQAARIAAAVNCGIPWRVAAIISDRIKIIKAGGVRIAPKECAGGARNRVLHRSHRKRAEQQRCPNS